MALNRKPKILFCASTPGHILHFHLPYLQAFRSLVYEVWVVASSSQEIPFADFVITLPFEKNLTSPRNLQAIWKARKLFKEHSFDVVSTHTTLASAVIRAAILTIPARQRPLVFCTSHGYLFSEKEGWKKWRYLLPEKLCARITDVTLVMNHEDLEIARHHHLYKDQLCFTDGMGLDLKRYHPLSQEARRAARKKAGYTDADVLFVYAAEFSPRKNQALLLRAFASVAKRHPEMKLLLAGTGALEEECKALVKSLHIETQIQFLGYVDRMGELYPLCDVSVTSSRIEGLPFNVMESMACGLPVVASDIKGHRELVLPGKTGLLFPSGYQKALEQQLEAVYQLRGQLDSYRHNALQYIQRYRLDRVLPDNIKIYTDVIRQTKKK